MLRSAAAAITEQLVTEGGAVIFNPTAGRGQGEALREEAQTLLGPHFEWVPSRRPGHARELAAEAAKSHPVVVAFGGDGTVGDVARGIYGTEAALGILPVGTGNDVARNLGLKLDLRESVATILGGVVRRIDMGLVNGIPFINNAGTGFDAQVMRTMNSSVKFTRGRPAFVLATLKTAPGFKPFTLTYEKDGEAAVSEKAMLVSVLNGRMYGAGMLAAPHADMEDGMLDVMIVKASAKLPLIFGLFPKMMQGQHEGHPAVEMFQARTFKLTCIPPQPINIDGDIRGLTPMDISVAPRAMKVLVR